MAAYYVTISRDDAVLQVSGFHLTKPDDLAQAMRHATRLAGNANIDLVTDGLRIIIAAGE